MSRFIYFSEFSEFSNELIMALAWDYRSNYGRYGVSAYIIIVVIVIIINLMLSYNNK